MSEVTFDSEARLRELSYGVRQEHTGLLRRGGTNVVEVYAVDGKLPLPTGIVDRNAVTISVLGRTRIRIVRLGQETSLQVDVDPTGSVLLTDVDNDGTFDSFLFIDVEGIALEGMLRLETGEFRRLSDEELESIKEEWRGAGGKL